MDLSFYLVMLNYLFYSISIIIYIIIINKNNSIPMMSNLLLHSHIIFILITIITIIIFIIIKIIISAIITIVIVNLVTRKVDFIRINRRCYL